MAAKRSEEAEAAVVQQVDRLLTEAGRLLSSLNLIGLTAEERTVISGRFRDGESSAMRTLLDVVDMQPTYFKALAAKDGGSDSAKVETAPTRRLLERRESLAPLALKLQTLATLVTDDVMATGAQVREIITPAYALGKANAPLDRKLKTAISPVINFYASKVKRGVRAER